MKLVKFPVTAILIVFVLSSCSIGPAKLATKNKIKRYESTRNIEKIVDIAKSGDKRERLLALESLGRLKDPRAIKTLGEALQSNSWVERETAARSLGRLKDFLAVKPLIKALNDEAKFVHESALSGLKQTVVSMSRSRDLRYFPPLFDALNSSNINVSDGVEEALRSGAEILPRFGDPQLIKPIIKGLEHEQVFVRTIAARLLGLIKEPSAVKALIQAQSDRSKSVRDASSAALQQIRDVKAVEPLIKALASKNTQVREEAADALGRFTDLKTVKRLLKELNNTNPQVRLGIAIALGDSGSAHAVKPLIKAMKDKDSEVRFASAQSLGRLFWYPETDQEKASYCAANRQWEKCVALGQIAIKPLLLALGDPDAEVRKEVGAALQELNWNPDSNNQKALFCVAQRKWDECIALGNLSTKALASELLTIDTESQIKIQLIKTMAAIKDEDAIEPLTQALQDVDISVRLEVVSALGAIDSPAIISALLTALDNNNGSVRQEAANTLEARMESFQKVKGSKAVNPIIVALGDNNRNVRIIAAKLLGDMKNPRATIPLIQALEDKEYEVREKASEALRKIKDPKTIQPLLHALKSNNPKVREHVVKTLGGFTDKGVIAQLLPLAKDRNAKVRLEVVKVLGNSKDAQSRKSLIEALSDFDEEVRIQASLSIVQSGATEAIPELLKTVRQDDVGRVRRSAGTALLDLEWKPESQKDKGLHCVISRDWNRCLDVGNAAVDALLNEMNKKDSPDKLHIARTLGGLRDIRSIKPLLSYMNEARKEKNLNDQEQILISTTAAIQELGKDAVPHVVPLLTDWFLGKQAGIILKELKWKPRSDAELVHFQVARRAKADLLSNWQISKKVLLKDLESKDPAQVQNAAFALIGLGKENLINPLVVALNNEGSLDMAEAYINSGNDILVKASVNWALQHNEKIHPNRKGAQPIVWGQM